MTGLNAPKGIAIANNDSKLYVSDITNLVEIDVASGKNHQALGSDRKWTPS